MFPPLPVVIVQHMSAGFHDGFAKWLAAASGLRVRIAVHGEHLAGRCAYLAPDVTADSSGTTSMTVAQTGSSVQSQPRWSPG